MKDTTAIVVRELKKLLDHDMHPAVNGPCERDCVERAVIRLIDNLEQKPTCEREGCIKTNIDYAGVCPSHR